MQREVSIYLDLLRVFAAFAVLGEHATDYVGGWIWRFGGYGAEAVAIFFVLSGFVIAFVSSEREQTAMGYAQARAIRMYSVVLPIMVVTWLIGIVGPRFDPSAFDIQLNLRNTWFDYLRCLTFLHQIWNTDTHFGVNGPYWSLGFEVPYYILFGVALFVRSRFWRTLSLVALLMLFGPRIALYFPLWLLGVGCYHFLRRIDSQRDALWLLVWLGSWGAILALHEWAHGVNDYLKIYRRFEFSAPYFETVAYFYGLGLLICANIVAFARLPLVLHGAIKRFDAPIRWVAGATFTLYLANLPTLLFAKSVLPPFSSENLRLSVVLVVTVVFCLVLAEIIERRKGILGRLFLRAWHRSATATS